MDKYKKTNNTVRKLLGREQPGAEADMYVCMYVCMYVYMQLCICVFMYMCIYVYVYVCSFM